MQVKGNGKTESKASVRQARGFLIASRYERAEQLRELCHRGGLQEVHVMTDCDKDLYGLVSRILTLDYDICLVDVTGDDARSVMAVREVQRFAPTLPVIGIVGSEQELEAAPGAESLFDDLVREEELAGELPSRIQNVAKASDSSTNRLVRACRDGSMWASVAKAKQCALDVLDAEHDRFASRVLSSYGSA